MAQIRTTVERQRLDIGYGDHKTRPLDEEGRHVLCTCLTKGNDKSI